MPVLATICAAIAMTSLPTATELFSWGKETLASTERHFAIPGSALYQETYEPGKSGGQPAYNWSVGVQLSALNAATRLDPSWKPRLESFATATHAYWNTSGPVAGFDVLPNPVGFDRYYDDNEWMVMALAETSDRLNDKKYLAWAKEALTYVLSGEDQVIGGGIYWKEREKTSKNTCSNGPAASACLAIYRHDKDPRLLHKAEELYAWCKSHLQDPVDHLYWDNIDLAGKIEKTKWSYNTALMIRSASELYALTHDVRYKEDVHEMAASSISRWYDADSGALKDDGRFAHLLLESWIFAYQDVPGSISKPMLLQITAKPMAFIHEQARTNGFYGHRWDRPDPAATHRFELIDQASAARSFFEAAIADGRNR